MTWTWHALWHQIIINNISNCRLCLKIDKAHHLLWHLDVNNSINHQTRSTFAPYKQAAWFMHTSSRHSSKVACLASKFGPSSYMHIWRVNSSSAIKTSYFLPLASTDKKQTRLCCKPTFYLHVWRNNSSSALKTHRACSLENNDTMQIVPFVGPNVSFLTAAHTHKHKNWRHCLFLQTSTLHLLTL